MSKISTQGRKALIRLASSMPVNSADRRAILVGLSKTGGFDPRRDDYSIDDQYWEYIRVLEDLDTDVHLNSADVPPIKMDGKKPEEAYLLDMGRIKDVLIGLDGGPKGVTFYGALAPNYPKGPMGPVYKETYRKVRFPSELLAAFNKFTTELESQIETYGMGEDIKVADRSLAKKYSKLAGWRGGRSFPDKGVKAVETRLRSMDAKTLIGMGIPEAVGDVEYIEGGKVKRAVLADAVALDDVEYEVLVNAVIQFKSLVMESGLEIHHGTIPLDIYLVVDENGNET